MLRRDFGKYLCDSLSNAAAAALYVRIGVLDGITLRFIVAHERHTNFTVVNWTLAYNKKDARVYGQPGSFCV